MRTLRIVFASVKEQYEPGDVASNLLSKRDTNRMMNIWLVTSRLFK